MRLDVMKLESQRVWKAEEMGYHLSISFEGSLLNCFINENPDNGVCCGPTVFDSWFWIKPST